ncbi:ABC transporter ATP-binding protein [Gemella morbillorum]|uniref:ATP-binding cassette domain-containing protein n=1 Tax=Gemella morbillorum TaxID=29391 RepID=A0AAP9HBR8_9BACL|nr:ABC transporter ATP-binding protein [Gemella morbillorum]EFV35158.1 ABC transporter [Gemella morbillorum M424]MDK8239077.1 ABC transporter ATP-binding protein [Gemella morbillorum]MDK8254429.1 ABC transporter ATP-binding protein [Gemella morbillorum]QGS08452.1 ATP-binding cassette domain-containing protein [Gemella morbillorum]
MKTKNPLLQFLPYIKNAKRAYVLGFIYSVLNVGLGVLGVYVLSKVFDGIEGDITKQVVLKSLIIAVGYGLILLCSGISNYIRNVYLVQGANEIYVRIQMQVYDHIQSLPIRYFDNMPAGSVVSRITSDVNQIRTFFVSTFVQILIIVMKVVFSYIVLFTVDYRFGLFMLALLPIMYIVLKIYNKLTLDSIQGYRRKFSESNGIINENYQNLEIIKAFNREEASIEDWNTHNEERYKYWKKLNVVDSLLLHNITGVFRVIIFIGIIYYYAYSHFNGVFGVTLGMVYLFINYTTDIIYRIADFTMGISNYVRAIGAANNIQEILKLDIEKDIEMAEVGDFRGNISFKDVSFAYKDDNYVLNNLNIEIKENQTVAFVGHTGSGKSTIMNLIVKFYDVSKGTLEINGKNINEYSREYLREKTAIVLQDSFLFDGTLLENITPNGNRRTAKEALEKVGGDFILKTRPLDSKVEIGGSNFSTGEKQLICLARALAKNPKILILDESTANIDSETEQSVGYAVEKLKQGRTTLIIAHRLSTIKSADNIFVLDKGRVVESGTHDELINLNGIYKKMYDTQIKG